jgi:hypothetical protein
MLTTQIFIGGWTDEEKCGIYKARYGGSCLQSQNSGD